MCAGFGTLVWISFVPLVVSVDAIVFVSLVFLEQLPLSACPSLLAQTKSQLVIPKQIQLKPPWN
jgi:hypothetical protein